MADIKVCKFSGAVLTGSGNIELLKEIIQKDNKRRIIVISAPGRTEKERNVTDLLIECGLEYMKKKKLPASLIQEIVNRYLSIFQPLNLSRDFMNKAFDDLKKRVRSLKGGGKKQKYLDRIKSFGEEYTALFIARYLQSQGLECRYMSPREAGVIVTPEFGNASLLEGSYDKLKMLREKKEVLIIPGFYGYTSRGDVATFSRGGNDLTGSILASAVEAELYENFIDYDGLTMVSSRLVPDARVIRMITYQELRELTYAGFQTFHEELLYPVMKKGVSMHLLNFFNLSGPGTMIVKEKPMDKDEITGIAFDKGFCAIHVEKYMMNVERGFGRHLLEIIERNKLSYDHSPSGIDTTSIILKQDQLPLEKIRDICRRIYSELNADNVYLDYNRALISVVGSGIKSNIGLLARMFEVFRDGQINVEMMIKGGSEMSIIFCVDQDAAEKAVAGLYRALTAQ
ncbi:MAG: aspartate kinase [bacterium]|nr:aspartate kinase [bacterium]